MNTRFSVHGTSATQWRTTTELRDLGELHPEWAGILSPMYDEDEVRKYIHEQFLDDATHYVERYQNLNRWRWLLKLAQPHLPDPSPTTILDIGSGAGNTIFPLLEIYPHARIIASDLSAPLLRLLRDVRDERYPESDCTLMQLNAENLVFEPAQFDLVVGGAILHHLFDPQLTLEQCYKVLKPDGCAVFFEPFELGNMVTGLALKHLLMINDYIPENAKLDPEMIQLFRSITQEWDQRKGLDKSSEEYHFVDDKWLFTRGYYERVAQQLGFREVSITPLSRPEKMFSTQVGSILQISKLRDLSTLPQWALFYLNQVDEQFTLDARRELMIEGCVILKK